MTFPASDFPDTDFNPDVHGQLLQTREGLEFVRTRAEPCVAYGPHGFPFEAKTGVTSDAPAPRGEAPRVGVFFIIAVALAVVGLAKLVLVAVAEVSR